MGPARRRFALPWIMLRIALLSLLVACGGGKSAPATVASTPPPAAETTPPAPGPAPEPDPASPSVEEVLAKFQGFQTEMCACADKACADKVNAAMSDWGKSMSDSKQPKLTDAQEQAFMKAAQAYGDCYTKAMGATTGAP